MPLLQLRHAEIRIAYLASTYYVALPRAAVDIDSMAAVREEFAGSLGDPHAAIDLELSARQLHQFGEALLGLINELKQYEMAHGRSAAPGFSQAMLQAFPEVVPAVMGGTGEPGAALDLVADVVAMRRRLDGAIRDAEATLEGERAEAESTALAERKPWWKVWGS